MGSTFGNIIKLQKPLDNSICLFGIFQRTVHKVDWEIAKYHPLKNIQAYS